MLLAGGNDYGALGLGDTTDRFFLHYPVLNFSPDGRLLLCRGTCPHRMFSRFPGATTILYFSHLMGGFFLLVVIPQISDCLGLATTSTGTSAAKLFIKIRFSRTTPTFISALSSISAVKINAGWSHSLVLGEDDIHSCQNWVGSTKYPFGLVFFSSSPVFAGNNANRLFSLRLIFAILMTPSFYLRSN